MALEGGSMGHQNRKKRKSLANKEWFNYSGVLKCTGWARFLEAKYSEYRNGSWSLLRE